MKTVLRRAVLPLLVVVTACGSRDERAEEAAADNMGFETPGEAADSMGGMDATSAADAAAGAAMDAESSASDAETAADAMVPQARPRQAAPQPQAAPTRRYYERSRPIEARSPSPTAGPDD